jgi:predicted nucleic acid-binding protein
VPGSSAVVIDSSALVALLADDGPAGNWVADRVAGRRLAVPGLALYEAGNVLRRQVLAGALDASAGALAHRSLQTLPLQRWPYTVLADRAWELRSALTMYDATFVALAELLGTRLLTLDRRIAGAPGVVCQVEAYRSPA